MTDPFNNILFLADSKSWTTFLLKDIPSSPQSYVIWVIVFLVVLFILSRLRNTLEEKSTARAMTISRGIVGTLTAFIITPIAFFILLNVMAMVYGINTIDIGFLVNWIGLTITSYWWLLKCAFGSESLSGAAQSYSPDSIIRILWILLPFSFIWWRMSKTKIGKLFLIPIIIGTFLLARDKKAPPTFITEDKALVQKIPFLKSFTVDPDSPYQTPTVPIKQRKILSGGLLLLLLAGFVVGLTLKKYMIGFVLASIGLLGFMLMAPQKKEEIIPETHKEHYEVDLDSLINHMHKMHKQYPDTIEIYNVSLKIDAAYHARIDLGDNLVFPDSLCKKYQSYFYDWCQ